jgi:hypothetical protein
MKGSFEGGERAPMRGLREYVLEVLPSLHVSVTSIEVEGDHRIKVKGKIDDGPATEDVYVEVLRQQRKVGSHVLSAFNADAQRLGIARKIFISASDYTQEAQDLAKTSGITLRNASDSDSEQDGQKRTAKSSHNIFERVYSSGWDMSEAQEYFARKRRKSFVGFFGSNETVESVEGRYAPIARFALKQDDGGAPGGHGPAKARSCFHVNLNTCELHYVYRGLTGETPSMRSTNILLRLMDLPLPAIDLFSWIIERQEVRFSRLTQNEQNQLGKNMGNLSTLVRVNLVSILSDHRGVISGYVANVNVPTFADGRYDIDKFTYTEESFESEYAPDKVEYNPIDVLNVLRTFFRCKGEFNGVTYLPYYICKYVDSDGIARFQSEYSVKFKNG